MFMKEYEKMIRLKALEFIYIPMELNMLATGLMISSMVTALKSGLMGQNMKGSTKTAAKKAKGSFCGLMEAAIWGTSL